MTVGELLARLEAAGIELTADGGRLLYDAPAGVLTAELRRTLKDRKAELLAALANAPRPAAASADAVYPLSFPQRSLWFLQALYPAHGGASEQFALRLRGPLDVPALARAWQGLLARHPILRVHCSGTGEAVSQRVGPLPPVLLPVTELAEARLPAVAAEALARPFDLHAGPLLRPGLFRLAADDHLLLVTAHHLVADGLSVPILRDDLAALYAAALARGPGVPELPAPAPQYLDQVTAGLAEPATARLEAGLAYWRRQLAALPPPLLGELVAPGGPSPGAGSRRVPFRFGPELGARLRAFARAGQATPFVVLLAAFRLLLCRLTGVTDSVIGTPLTLRDTPALGGVVGCCVNPVALRTATPGDATFRQLVAAERATLLGALDHRAVPFARVVAALAPVRRLGEHPLFQVLFTCEAGAAPRQAGALSVALEAIPADRASYFELECGLKDEPDGAFTGHLAWSRRRLEDWVASALPARFEHLLQAALARPDAPVASLPLLGADEAARLRASWGDGGALPGAVPATVQDLFLAQAARRPGAPALRGADRAWTYAELAAASERLARALVARGVAPGAPVGLALGRGPELVLALLGVLRARAIPVPLDPAYPPARRAFMAADGGLVLQLTGPGGVAAAGVPAVAVTALLATGPFSDAPLPAGEGGDGLVLLYTSGSTGEPKGALTLQRNGVHRVVWMQRVQGIGADEVFALRTSPNFIDSLWEIFGALGGGAPLLILDDALASDPLGLPAALAAGGVTHLVLGPALLEALLGATPALGAAVPSLRSCVSSGEPLPPDLARRFLAAVPGARLFNTYGTSEIWDAACQALGPGPEAVTAGAVRVPIGRPLPGVQIAVVDRSLGLLPPGVPGELLVGGIGVGPGYWRRPDLTAEKFVPDPWGGSGRVYRTGDRARWLADGSMELLGRLDAQLKVRGFRVEAAEVEQALSAHPQVAAAAVAVRGEAGGGELVGYVVPAVGGADPAGGPEPLAPDLVGVLREWLGARLPAPMIPTTWLVLPRLPRTPSGKLDRRGLPAPAPAPTSPPARGAGDGSTLQRLAALWTELLGQPPAGPAADFFATGGHSLLAVRLVSRVKAAFGVELALREVFEQPTLGGLAGLVAQRPAAGPRPGTSSRPPLLPRPGPAEPLPLSFGQERLWFLDQLDPGSPAYNIAWSLRLAGPLDAAALGAALDWLVARHDALRSRFPATAPVGEGGVPRVVIDPPGPVPLPVRDIGDCDEAAEQALLTELARAPFDLGTGPLFRCTLLRRGPDRHRLLLVFQHIITDATSNQVLLDELWMAYEAFHAGRAPELPAPVVRYTDFAAWQRHYQSGPAVAAELAWWQARLADAPALLDLPTDHPRPAEQRFRGAWVWRSVPPALTDSLRGLARQSGCTLYVLLLAAFKVLLHRLTGSADILVGSPVEGRLERGLETLVGLCINTLVLRTDLGGEPTFSTLLARVRETALSAQAHQEVPFERLVQHLAPARSLARAPLFQVMFNLLRLPAGQRRVAGLAIAVDRLLDQGVASFDLGLTVAEQDTGLELVFEYATDLFDAGTIRAFAAAYGHLLAAVCANPDVSIARLPLEAPSAAAARIAALNPPAPASAGPLLPVVVAGLAASQPAAPALVAGPLRLSYGELEQRANRLAHALLAAGAGPGRRVALCLPRSADYLVAVLAVLKTGAAYLPLDPDYPPARLAWMLADGGPAVLVTGAGGFPGTVPPGLPVVPVAAALDANRTDTPPAVTLAGDAPAYVLYTSGSTGQPRAVVVSHASLAAALRAWQSAYGLRPGEAHLQMASAAFDVFTGDWVRALGSGGSLVICPREVLLDPPALLALIRRERIQVAEFVPAVVRLLLASELPLPPLRLLIVGSDVWHGTEYQALRSRCGPGTRVINSYGVAEATIDSAWFELPADAPAPPGPLPIGRPFANSRLYVLDRHLQPVLPGVAGELCIGGQGVALGYLHGPADGPGPFLPDPFSPLPGGRLYRTGDRARQRADGTVALLGRLDGQLKLRGFRIEPAEVEAALTALPGVAAAAVALRDEQLVAYVVPAGDAAPGSLRPAELRTLLLEQLPDYLVPGAILPLPALPLSPNGKLDRNALPAPPAGALPAGAGPRTPLEEMVCSLMAEVLDRPTVPVDADFFALGGHSLLATRLLARLRDTLDATLPLRAVFEEPTAAGLARRLPRRPGTGDSATRRVPPLGPRPRTDGVAELPLSLAQQRLWFLARLEPGNAAWHLHWTVELRGELDRAALGRALLTLVARHESLRTRFGQRDGVGVQFIDPPATRLPDGVFTVRERPGAGAADLAAELRSLLTTPFDLEAGPPLRVTVLATGAASAVLVLVIHHIVADGWSLSVLCRELALAYGAERQDGRPALPPLPLQYGDYACWQREWLAAGGLAADLDYWRGALAGAPPVLRPAPDRRPGPGARASAAWHDRLLPGATLDGLKALTRSAGGTLFMTVLSAFAVVLGRYADTEDVVVGTPVAGRGRTELEGLIGLCVNTLALRIDLRGRPSFRTLLARVKAMTLAAFEHGELPFEQLVEALAPVRSLDHGPLVQVQLVFHNQPRAVLELPGLAAATLPLVAGEAKYDLNLHVAEEDGGLRLALGCRTDLYSETWAERCLADLATVLATAVATPDAPVATLAGRCRRPPAPPPAPTATPVPAAPADPAVVTTIAAIWGELLGRERVGPDEDFFALGGHSLLALRLLARLETGLGVTLPLAAVFEAPTVAGLAARVATARRRAGQCAEGVVAPAGPPPPTAATGPIPRLPRRSRGAAPDGCS